MSSGPATARTSPARPRGRARARRRQLARRRLRLLAGALILVAAVVALVNPFEKAVKEIALPLRHEDIIRQQAAEKGLDPALIAAVIYQESKFEDRTSSAGAKGLMQILPDTANFIARKSGGSAFELRDLATPQINIAYGSWYLRYLIDRYNGNVALALAAYNAGETTVDRWVAQARSGGHPLAIREIPYPETRLYVEKVLRAQQEYRHAYGKQLGY